MGLKRSLRAAATRVHRSAVVLAYHRVADPDGCGFRRLAVSPDNFSAHLRVMQQTCNPVHLVDLIELASAGRVPPRTVALTFDDGYADFALAAAPLLKQARVPATVFIATGSVESGREFWWEEAARVADAAVAGNQPLEIETGRTSYRWTPGPGCSSRMLFSEIHPLLAAMTAGERDAVMDSLFATLGLPRTARDRHRPMTVAEVEALCGDALLDVGAHTESHPKLASLEAPEQQREISRSKRFLEALLDGPVRTFSYPFGDPDTFTPETVAILGAEGFDLACTYVPGAIRTLDRPLELPRCAIYDIGEAEFRARIDALFWEPEYPAVPRVHGEGGRGHGVDRENR